MRFILFLWVLSFCSAQTLADFRCGTSLVKQGDWAVAVREQCGEPDYIANYPESVVAGLGVVRSVEHWYYNRGASQFIRRLVFRGGRLHKEEKLGYGFPRGSVGDCSPGLFRTGISEYEVVARCGEPLAREVTWQAPPRSKHSSAFLQPVLVEEWLYEFGRADFRRVLVFRNGRLLKVSLDDKPG